MFLCFIPINSRIGILDTINKKIYFFNFYFEKKIKRMKFNYMMCLYVKSTL